MLAEKKADTHGYSIYNPTGDDSAIKIAVKNEYESIVNFLLENGANASCRNAENLPLLVVAAQLESEKMIQQLLKHGASIYEAIIAAHQQFEIDNDDLQYEQTLQVLFDYAFGLDLPKEARELNFLKEIDLKDIQFAGISVYGQPITHEMLRQCQLHNWDKAIVTIQELENLKDANRSAKLLDRLQNAINKKGRYIENGIVNLVPLVRAVQTGDLRTVKARLKAENADPNSSEQYSPLEPIYFAAKKGFSDIIDLLYHHPKFDNHTLDGAIAAAEVAEQIEIAEKLRDLQTINSLDEKGYAKLHLAVESGNIEEIKKLLAKGANVNLMSPDGYPLTIAAKKNNVAMLALLLEKRADPNLDFEKMSALEYATTLDAIKILLPAMDKEDTHSDFYCWYRVTLINALESPECIEILKLLQAENADLNIKDFNGNTILHDLLKGFPSIKTEPKKFCHYMERFHFLIENGINPNHQNFKGDTALHLFLKNIHFDDLPQLCVKIIDQCIKKHFNVNTPGENGTTLLHIAVAQNNLELVKFLVMRGADIHVKDDNGCTPLHMATATDPALNKKGFIQSLPEIVEYLLKHTNIDIHAINNMSQTPIQYSRFKCAEELKKDKMKVRNFEWINDFHLTQGLLGIPFEKVKKPAPSESFSDNLKEYKKICKSEPDFESIFAEYKISEDDLIWVNVYRDEFSQKVMRIPVKLNGHVYDFDSLMKIYFSNKQKDPTTGQMFHLSDIEPAFTILQEIEKLAALLKDKYAPKPLPKLSGNPSPLFARIKDKKKVEEAVYENNLTHQKRSFKK